MKRGSIDLIGETPLVYLKNASEITSCNIYGKCEFFNPGGSIKDRAALGIIKNAIDRGELKPGMEIIEGTAGNTGIGLSYVAANYDLKVTIVMPNNQSREKVDLLKLLGADVIEVATAPYKTEGHFVKIAKRLSKERNIFFANQFDNLDNQLAHYNNTGSELANMDIEGSVDGFICAVGTGGTLSGVAKRLREANQAVKIGLADPYGSALYNIYQFNRFQSEGSSIIEGIGQGRITENLVDFTPDHCYKISDQEALDSLIKVRQTQGLLLGGSSGINIAAAIKFAKLFPKGSNIVTILADSGSRYFSTLFNPQFLASKDLQIKT